MSIWKILDLHVSDNRADSVRFKVSLGDVETENNYQFKDKSNLIVNADTEELTVISWLKKEMGENGVNEIELNLQKQADEVSTKIRLPWEPAETFKPFKG